MVEAAHSREAAVFWSSFELQLCSAKGDPQRSNKACKAGPPVNRQSAAFHLSWQGVRRPGTHKSCPVAGEAGDTKRGSSQCSGGGEEHTKVTQSESN